MQAAFDRWLKRGRPGYVATQWPDLAGAVQCISAAAGVAVLAHPHRYQVSNGVLRTLVEQFKAAGGVGLEVSLAGMGPGDADRAATLARVSSLPARSVRTSMSPGCHGVRWVASLSYRTG